MSAVLRAVIVILLYSAVEQVLLVQQLNMNQMALCVQLVDHVRLMVTATEEVLNVRVRKRGIALMFVVLLLDYAMLRRNAPAAVSSAR